MCLNNGGLLSVKSVPAFPSYRYSLLMLLGAAAIVLLVSQFFQGTLTNDAYWHIKMGQLFLQEPFFAQDDFSFTHAGQSITSYPYIFELLLYGLDKVFGYELMSSTFLLLAYSSGLLSIGLLGRLSKWSGLEYAVAVIGLSYYFSHRLLIRPDLLYYLFIGLSLYIYGKCIDRFNLKSYGLLCGLMFVWSNYYTPIFLYVICGGLYLQLAINNFNQSRDLKWWSVFVASGVLLLSVEFLSPFPQSSLIAQLDFDSRWQQYLVEYWNIFHRYGGSLDIYLFALLAFLTVLMSVLSRQWGFLFIAIAFSIASILYARIVPFAGFVFLLLSIQMLSVKSVLYGAEKQKATWISWALLLALGGGLANSTLINSTNSRSIEKPDGLVKYYKSRGYAGNIYNDYNLGGYLIYHLYPESKVFIDGRAGLLYDVEFFEKHRYLMSNESRLLEANNEYNIDFLVIDKDLEKYSTAYRTGLYGLEYVDKDYALLKKGNTRLNQIGKLLVAPYCWSLYSLSLSEELISAEDVGADGVFKHFIRTLRLYNDTNDMEALAAEIPASSMGADSQRFIAYQLFANGNYALAQQYFDKLETYLVRDVITIAFLSFYNEDYVAANRLISKVLNNSTLRFTWVDALLIYKLGRELEREKVLAPRIAPTIKLIESRLTSDGKMSMLNNNVSDLLCAEGI